MKSVFYDINDDGYEDCIVGGNIFDTEVETPRLDGVSGVVLISNKKDGYTALNYEESGLYLTKDTKDMAIMNFGKTPLLISANNNNSLNTYKFRAN